mmetsp:Transcript_7578/g.13728  ORF Transcript_7578/g.13728 Transcript_7578/m.13728 type:complete len:287 (+) Transcript_7578:46-906(+)
MEMGDPNALKEVSTSSDSTRNNHEIRPRQAPHHEKQEQHQGPELPSTSLNHQQTQQHEYTPPSQIPSPYPSSSNAPLRTQDPQPQPHPPSSQVRSSLRPKASISKQKDSRQSGELNKSVANSNFTNPLPYSNVQGVQSVPGQRLNSVVKEMSYAEIQQKVNESLNEESLTASDKLALSMEILRARQLELDLLQARSNIEALVTKATATARTLRAVIPSVAVHGLPLNTPIELSHATMTLRSANDPSATFLSLELHSYGVQKNAEGNGTSDAAKIEKVQSLHPQQKR